MELADGKPFVGRSGKLLNILTQQAGLDVDSFFIANSAVCRIDKDIYTIKQVNSMLAHCRRFVERAARLIKPRAIIALGGLAIQQLLKLTNIKKRHGSFVWSEEFQCWVMLTYHPAFCLRSPGHVQDLLSDFRKFKRFQDNNYIPLDVFSKYEFIEIDDVNDIPTGSAVAIDTETQGLDWLGKENFLVSYSLCFGDNKAYQVYLHERDEASPDFWVSITAKEGRKQVVHQVGVKRALNYDSKAAYILGLVGDPLVKKYMFNGAYDLLWLNTLQKKEHFLSIKNYVIDVQAAAHLLDENVHKSETASLEQARKYYTVLDTSYSIDFETKYSKASMIEVPKVDLNTYACADAVTTYEAALTVKSDLITASPNCDEQMRNYFLRFVMPTLTYTIPHLVLNGAAIDKEQLPVIKETLSGHVMSCFDKAVALIPPKVLAANINKTKLTRKDLIRDTLFSEDGYNLVSENKTAKGGSKSVNEKSRVALRNPRTPKAAIRFLDAYEEWGKMDTLLSRYIKNFEKSIRSDGRVHPSYSLVSTVTGRTSAANPSLQNIPRAGVGRELRRLVVAREGYQFLAFDASQAEIRWMCQLSQDNKMVSIYRADGDIHTITAEAITGKTKIQMTSAEFDIARQGAKVTNFGMLYGLSAYGLKRDAKIKYGLDLTDAKAEEYHKVYFQTYPGVKQYHIDTLTFAKEHEYVVSPFGRRRRLPGINSTEEREANHSRNQAFNFAIQSASSDTVLLACNELLRKELLIPSEAKPVMFVHDELIFEVREDLIDKYVPIIKQEMEHPPLKKLFGIKMLIPLKVEAKVGPNYADLEAIEI
jgi:uracil-DNA glycosylase family 4